MESQHEVNIKAHVEIWALYKILMTYILILPVIYKMNPEVVLKQILYILTTFRL